ncbi:MAG: Ig-like domain-containing protein [Prolixibacteraceae bacterium]|nr:Ig-like domain-containing protein [Prolixibacteraceae bacterium]
MYVRIKPEIIIDGRGLTFAGFNTNGQADDTPWNFSTKDGEAPEATFAMLSCFANTNFTITLDETGIIDANELTNSNVDGYVSFSGGDFDATIVEGSVETVITVTPADDLDHDTEYTVSLLAGLIDESDNAIAADSEVFTSGDYQLDALTIKDWKSPDGTSFSINLESPEDALYYYIVVRADSVDVGTADKYAPESAEVIFDVVDTPSNTYEWIGTSASTDNKNIDVYESGTVNAPSETELLEHITELEATHGMDYVVYMFGADESVCGSNDFLPTNTYNVGPIVSVRPSTYDVLPPEVTFSADLVDEDDIVTGCDIDGIKRGGAVYISFNEAVEKENGQLILPADIPGIVSLQGSLTSNYSVDVSRSFYDDDDMQLVIYPTVAFSSSESLTVSVNYNTIQDAADEDRFGPNGNELLSSPNETFCVEAYLGPIVSFEPCDSTEDVDRDKVIVITIDQYVYAPAVDGYTLTDVLGDDTFVGNYIQMRKYLGLTDAPAALTGGQIIYSGDDPGTSYFLDNVTFGVEYNDDGETVITITPKAPYEFDSETWYTVALEQALRTEDNLTIEDTYNNGDAPADGCAIENYWTSFRSEDSRPPEVIFYEDDDMVANDPGVVEPYLDENFDVADTAFILVEIDEWVQLGFDGFKNLEPTEKIEDANALRRYFALNIVNEDATLTPVSFDVKNFTLDVVGDIARFYIDPYYTDKDDPNFTEDVDYQVCFIDNPNELEDYLDDPALTDDNMNALAEACANFTVPAPVVPTECIVSASLNEVELDLTNTDYAEIGLTEDSLFTIEFVFGGAMEGVSGPALTIYEEGGAAVTTIDAGEGSPVDAFSTKISYELDLHGTIIADNSNYYIHFDLDSAIVATGAFDCAYPSEDDFTVAMFTTIDATAPLITAFVPDNPDSDPYATCLADKDETDIIITWDEDVTPQSGKKIELWRLTGDATLIAYIDASYNIAEDDNEIIFDKSLFQHLLAYNTQYYIHIPEGFVLNEVGLPNAEVTVNDSLTFCVGPDPIPEIICGDLVPNNPVYSTSTTPDLEITFSEAVVPVSGIDIQVYKAGTITNVTDAYLHVSATAFTEVAGSSGTKWKLNTEIALANAGVYEEFEWDSCYDVNIRAGAFKEAAGSQVTEALITNDINSTLTSTTCTWTFCIGDNIAPTVTFWPEDDDEHIATNAHLYAYISELPILADGDPLNVSNAADYFTLDRAANAEFGAATDIDFDIEFVGTDVLGEDNDKQHIRIVPRDPNGPDWSLTADNNPSMVDEAVYTLSFINLAGAIELQDENGNAVVDKSVSFTTEDITAPEFDGTSVDSESASKIEFSAEINEEGTIRYVIVEAGDDAVTSAQACVDDDSWMSLGVEAGEAETDGGVAEFEFTADPGEGEYDYDIYFFAYDDEVDLYDEDSEIEATWPYADETMGFETENYRIKDLRPAPNGCTVEGPLAVSFCDDDAPVLLTGADDETYPTVGSYIIDLATGMPTDVDVIAVEDSIVLEFNEDIQINDADVTGNKIVLRDYHNNLGVPLAYVIDGNTITLYPLDSTLIANEAEAFQLLTSSSPRTILPQESMYYLEIDRWAISDVDGCNGDDNYFGEWVGKDYLAFATEDNTAPCDVDWAPTTCVEPEADIEITFFEKNEVMINPAITGDSAYVYIYRIGEIDPHERIPVSLAVKEAVEDEDNQWKFTIPTSYMYLSGETYRVRVPAGLFIDNSGNEWDCSDGASWTFDVRDYEAPIASWTVVQDFSYLGVALDDDEYNGMVVSGDAGETINNVPTSSLLKVEFNESVFLQDSDNSDAWTVLSNSAVYDEFAAALTLTENGTPLTWDSDNNHTDTDESGDYTISESGADYAIIKVYRSEDRWSPALTGLEEEFGLKSNTEYVISLDDNVFTDAEDCDDERNIYGGDDPLVIINTRDDIPPVLTIMDVSGDDVCENQCVAAGSPIHLQFDHEVVKTPFAGIDYDSSSGWPSGDVNWWSEANLPLLESDLTATMNGDFLTFYETNEAGTSTGDSVVIESVEVVVEDGKSNIYLTLAEPLNSQGWYYIEFSAGSVKDTKRVPDGNEFMGKDCIFRVMDTEVPYAEAFYPSDESNPGDFTNTNVLKESTWNSADLEDDEMAILFSEPVATVASSTDSLVIRRMNGQVYATVSANDVYVDEDNERVLHIPVVSPAEVEGTFEEFTAYYVEVPAGFVTDTTSCERNGSIVIDPELAQFEWNFSTSDDTPPTPIVFIPNDTRDEDGNLIAVNDSVPKNSDLTIIFDENIIVDDMGDNSGIYIYHHDNTMGWVGDPGEDFGNIVEFIPFYVGPSSDRFANYDLDAENVYNGLTNNILTVNPNTTFTRTGTYYIRVSGDVIGDAQSNYWDGVGDTITWRFTITNDVAPVLASTDPAYNHNTNPWEYEVLPAEDYGYVIADLSMSFVDELDFEPLDVEAGEGTIRIYEYRYDPESYTMVEKLWKTFDVNDEAVVFEGNTVIIEDVELRDNINRQFGAYEESYYVMVDNGAITNDYPGSLTYFGGIDNPFVWRFQTGNDDVFVPGYDILSPTGEGASNLTIADVDSLVVAFNEGVEALTDPAGMLMLHNITNGKTDTITIVADMCADSTLTVNIADYLVDESDYYVFIQTEALGDTSTVSTPNDFTIGGETEWYFNVGDYTGPTATAVTPADDSTCVPSEIVLSMTFEETFGVVAGAGSIELTDSADFTMEIAIADMTIGEDNNSISAVVNGLPDTTLIFVNVPEGLLIDGSENANLSPAQAWSFTTGENTLPTAEIIAPLAVVDTSEVELIIEFSEEINADDSSIDVNGKVYAMTRLDSVTYTVLVDSLLSDTINTVTFMEGTFYDNAVCEANYIAAGSELTFDVMDIIAPVATYFPYEAGDYTDIELAIVFDNGITKEDGYVVIYDADTDEVADSIDIADFTDAGDNTFTYVTNDLYYGSFYVQIDKGSFMDYDAAPMAQEYEGIADAETWTIDIVDVEFVKCYNIITPEKNATGVDVNTTISISFCDERIAPPVREERYVSVANSNESFTFVVDETMIEGNTLTFDVEGLAENTQYSVYIQTGAITDEAGNEWDVKTDAEWWPFTTGDFTAPIATLTPVTVTEGEGSATMSSNENGVVYLVKDDVDTDVTVMESAIADGKAVKVTVVADVDATVSIAGLVPGTYNAVAVDNADNVGDRTSEAVVVEEEPVILEIAIADAQDRPGSTDYTDQVVILKGIVTITDNNGFYMQDDNAEWSGIYVYDSGNSAVNVGSAVEVQGKIGEFNNITQISDVTVTGTLLSLNIEPVPIPDTETVGESYESVRVMVSGRATETVEGNVTIANEGGATYAIDLYIYQPETYSWTEEFRYEVAGIVYGGGDDYKVEPYFDYDIVNASLRDGISLADVAIDVYPNPFDNYIKFDVSHDVHITKAVITNIAGQLVKEVHNPKNTIQTSELRSGAYFLSLHTEEGVAKAVRIIKR